MILLAMRQYLVFCLLVAALIIEVDAFVADLIRYERRTIATTTTTTTTTTTAATTKTDSQMENTHPSFPSSSSAAAEKSAMLKRIVFIRHGQTYMNELIGGGGISFGEPNFTDIFTTTTEQEQYEDSPLSEIGIQQAISLNHKLHDLKYNKPGAIEALGLLTSNTNTNTNTNTSDDDDHKDANLFLDDLDLVVVSPLTRALQTMELALYEHIIVNEDEDDDDDVDGHSDVPIIAMPKAAERLYLVSDIGKSRPELRIKYPWVDFDTGFSSDSQSNNCSTSSENDNVNDNWHFSPSKEIADNYIEWRPHGQGQEYACLGEPQEYFDQRMTELYLWLESRKEKCIAVICHAGVIDWMTSGDVYSNCELRIQTFKSLRPRNLSSRK